MSKNEAHKHLNYQARDKAIFEEKMKSRGQVQRSDDSEPRWFPSWDFPTIPTYQGFGPLCTGQNCLLVRFHLGDVEKKMLVGLCLNRCLESIL